MLPTFVEEKCVFEFSQNLEIIYRETADSHPLVMKTTQQGLLFIESKLTAARVVRFMVENLLSPKSMAHLSTVEQAPRKEYMEEHLKLYYSLKRPFGLELPLEFTTDLLNGSAAPSSPFGSVGPGIAMPYDILHFPFVMPALSGEEPEVGKSWKSVVVARCGFGTFNVPYSAKWVGMDPLHATAEITFDPPAEGAKPAVANGVQLVFRPTGTWTVSYSLFNGAPARAKGRVQYVAAARVPPVPEVIEVINAKADFEWKKVMVAFNNKFLMPAGWSIAPAA